MEYAIFILYMETRHFSLKSHTVWGRPLRGSQGSQHVDQSAKDGTVCINNIECDLKGNEVSEAINNPFFIEQLLYNRMG